MFYPLISLRYTFSFFKVCEDWKIKVCDFGFARKAEAKADYLTLCGTDEWMAPEVGLGTLPLPEIDSLATTHLY